MARQFQHERVEDHVLPLRAAVVGGFRLWGHSFLLAQGLRSERPRLWLAAGAASVAADVAVVRWLASSDGEHSLVRLLHDALDTAMWIGACTADPATTRALAFVTLGDALEGGYRLGRAERFAAGPALRSLLPAIGAAAVTAALRRRRGWHASVGQMGWALAGAAAGYAAGQNQRGNERRAASLWRDATGPSAAAAWRIGQHDLALSEKDEDSPHSLKKELLVLEQLYGSAEARHLRDAMSRRKEEVEELTDEFGIYLGRAALGVAIFPPGAWSIRLSKSQAEALRRRLPENPGVSEQLVVLNEAQARRPGADVLVRLATGTILLPGVARPERWTSDLAPLGFLVSAVIKCYCVLPDAGAVPAPVPLLCMLVDLVASFAYRAGRPVQDPDDERASAQAAAPITVALGSNLLFAVVAPLTARGVYEPWDQPAPGGEGIYAYNLIAARYWNHLTAEQRSWVLVGSFALGALSMVMNHLHPDGVYLLGCADILRAALPFVVIGMGRRVFTQEQRTGEAMTAASIRSIDLARQEGVDAERRRFLAWVDHGSELVRNAPTMPETDRVRLLERFREVQEWLRRPAISS